MKHDILSDDDVKLLVDTFYVKVQEDALLAPVFNDFAKVDWDSHLPIMYSFWSSILLGAKTYRGQPFPKHMPLPIQGEHFGRWLDLFFKTLEELFAGPNADHAKQRAATIAMIFQNKLQGLSSGLIIAGRPE